MTSTSLAITTGAWWVAATGSGNHSRIIAVRNTGERASVTLQRFPVGWRAGQVWDQDSIVPTSVRNAAATIAFRMTRQGL